MWRAVKACASERQVAGLGIGGRVTFAGAVADEEKWRLFRAANLYVSTTHHEGFGIAFLEAMQAGLPVVTYDSGGQRDLVRKDEGVLVSHGDQGEFGRALARLATAPGERERLAAAAQARAREYTVERCAERYLELYRECLARLR